MKITEFSKETRNTLCGAKHRLSTTFLELQNPGNTLVTELSMGRVHPWVGSDRVGLGRVGSKFNKNPVGRVGSWVGEEIHVTSALELCS